MSSTSPIKQSPITGLVAFGGGSGSYLLGRKGIGGYEIQRSLRFNSADSAYLNRTPSSAGNRKTWTWAGWVKRSKLSSAEAGLTLFSAGTGTSLNHHFGFSYDSFYVAAADGAGIYLYTTPVFRDTSAWYHIVVASDTSQATPSNRIKVYINGSQVTQFSSSTYPSQDYVLSINNNVTHKIGARERTAVDQFFDGYLADVHFIDGQALAPTEFGEFDADGVWDPKEYAGTYGTNGFHLDFSDNSSNAALGDDSSGNNNDWTVNNLVADGGGGVVYSNYVTGYLNSLYDTATYPVTNLFDGSTSTIVFSSSTSGSGIKFVPPSDITGSIELYLRNGDTVNSTFSYSLDNGSTFTNLTTTGGSGSYVSIGSQTISNTNGIIVRHVTTAGTNRVIWRAIRVDSTVLTDVSPSDTDSLIDTPTNYEASSGNNGGNYATLNPLAGASGATLSNGNLDRAGGFGNKQSTIGMSSGKWYWEVTVTDATALLSIGVTEYAFDPSSYALNYSYASNGSKWIGTSNSSYGASYTAGDVIGFALDMDNGNLVAYKNGSSQGTLASSLTGKTLFANLRSDGTCGMSANFGQRPFAYPPGTSGGPSSDYKSLCTQNLDTPVVAQPSSVMGVITRSGLGSSGGTVSGLNFAPDLIWEKRRDSSSSHYLFDAVRGLNAGPYLSSNSTGAESSTSSWITGSTSTGYTVNGNDWSTTASIVAWAWDAGTTTATNNNGSIQSTVRANQSAGFSIVTYTGNQTEGATVGHGLNSQPLFITVKDRSTTKNWYTLVKTGSGTGASSFGVGYLNDTAQFGALNTDLFRTNSFDNTPPTSSVFQLGSDNGNWSNTLNDTNNYVAYCFAPVEGYSAFGSYTGNGSTDGPFVYTGFRPAFLMFKRTDSTGTWEMYDTARDTYNPYGLVLTANSSDAEADVRSGYPADMLSNGFKLRHTGAAVNASGGTYIYAAFAEHPFKTARAR